jgi:transposase
MEPPETGAPGSGTKRRSYRALEEIRVAQDKKNAKRLGAYIVFCDESGFLLIPNVVRTWAPRGETPIVRHRYRRDKVSVISGISVSPRRQRLGLYFRLFPCNIGHAEVCQFLRDLLRHLRGPVITILDNSTTHRGEPIQMLLGKIPRLRIEYFPAYAPQLNPDEAVWSLAKRKLANSKPDNVDQLVDQVIDTLEDIRCSPVKLRGCFEQSELPPFLHGLLHYLCRFQ